MESTPRAKPVFGPSTSLANRVPLNSISQTTLNQLSGESGGSDTFSFPRKMEPSTPFDRKQVPLSSHGAAGYPPLAFSDAGVTPEKYVLPAYAATAKPRSKYAWYQRPSSSMAVEAACFRPTCPLSPLTEHEKATVGLSSMDFFTPTRRLLQTPNAVDSMTAYSSAASNFISSASLRPIARPSEGESKVGLASVPAQAVPVMGVVRPEVQTSSVFQSPKIALRRAPISGKCAVPAPTTACSAQQFDMEEDAEFWKTHNVQVLIRIRPLSSSEMAAEGSYRCVRQESPKAITWLGSSSESRYTFDHVACEGISQENLFRVAGLPMVNNCIDGYNSCIFAYGQTGSGKTYTMLGDINDLSNAPCENRGITSRVFEHLFARIHADEEAHRNDRLEYHCKCTFLEIYNEQITDLLRPTSRNLQVREVREDDKKKVYVENLAEVTVSKLDDVVQLLLQGAANMKVAATKMNAGSSRSHTVFTCDVEREWGRDATKIRRFGRLNLVDLAGSERQKSSGAEGEVLKEAANINRSLHCLGNVLIALEDLGNGRPRNTHVPYRDSKLTFLLQDSLGGNSKTAVIANISPSICCAQETLSTLKFAQRAKRIQNNAVVNEDKHADVTALHNENELLKDQLEGLRRQSVEERIARQEERIEWEEERMNLISDAAEARAKSAALAIELQRLKSLLFKETDALKQATVSWKRERQDLLSKLPMVGSANVVEGQIQRSIHDLDKMDARLRKLEERQELHSSTKLTTSSSQGTIPLEGQFHTFDNDRTQRHFVSGQIWAVYDRGADRKPRQYVQVSEVNRAPFHVVMRSLAPLPSEQNTAWGRDTGMAVPCGRFKVGNNSRVDHNVDRFSHLVTPLGGLKEIIEIYPRKQDVWALYRSWDEKLPDSRNPRRTQYDLVEVMSDFCDVMGVDVALLSKVSGFRTLFKRCQAPPIAYPAKEVLRFSYKIPAYRMAGSEVEGLPKDCLELDPACIPQEYYVGT